MLRILVFDEPYSVKLRLEGELTAQTVPVLTQRWAEVRSRLKSRKAILDLGGMLLKLMRPADTRWPGLLAQEPGWATPTPTCVRWWKNWPAMSLGSRVSQLGFGNDCTWWIVLNAGILLMNRLCRLVCAVLPPAWRPCGCRTV